MTSNKDLVQGLREIQKRAELTDGQMAEKLGCTRQLYQATKTNKVPVGLTILKGACKAFPELIGDAIIFLTDGVDMRAITADISTAPYQTHQDKQQGGLRKLLRALHLSIFISDRSKPTKSKSGRMNDEKASKAKPGLF